MRVTPTLSAAEAVIVTTPDTVCPAVGEEMATVGGVVSFVTVTVTGAPEITLAVAASQGVHVGADVGPIGRPVLVRTGRRQTIIVPCEIHEAHGVERGGEEVVRGIDCRVAPRDDVALEHRQREVAGERADPFRRPLPHEAEPGRSLGCEVVAVDEPGMRDPFGVIHVLLLEPRVVLDHQVGRPSRIAQDLKEPPVTSPGRPALMSSKRLSRMSTRFMVWLDRKSVV